jgi:hypothetical protein
MDLDHPLDEGAEASDEASVAVDETSSAGIVQAHTDTDSDFRPMQSLTFASG